MGPARAVSVMDCVIVSMRGIKSAKSQAHICMHVTNTQTQQVRPAVLEDEVQGDLLHLVTFPFVVKDRLQRKNIYITKTFQAFDVLQCAKKLTLDVLTSA